MRGFLIACVVAASLAAGACSDAKKAPEGRWEGVYTGGDMMIVARVEVERDGTVRLSAPNAFMNFAEMDEASRADVRARLRASLAAAWPKVASRPMDFDGTVFRKPGGVAPQLEWDKTTGHMTMFVYPGARATIRFELVPVEEFGS